MASRRLTELIRALRDQADVVILDTPPCGILADSAALAKLADGTLYVVKAGVAQVPHILDSLQFLASGGTPVLGCVLNDVPARAGGYRYGYGYGYGYGSSHQGRYRKYRKDTQQ